MYANEEWKDKQEQRRLKNKCPNLIKCKASLKISKSRSGTIWRAHQNATKRAAGRGAVLAISAQIEPARPLKLEY